MSEKSNELKAAEWLIVGFLKSWTIQMLRINADAAIGVPCSDFKFYPSDESYWRGRAPVRAYVAQNWPKLADYLDKASPEKRAKAAEQILRLKWNGERPVGSLSRNERDDIAKTKKDLRGQTTSYNQSRTIFKAHALSNWNVCK